MVSQDVLVIRGSWDERGTKDQDNSNEGIKTDENRGGTDNFLGHGKVRFGEKVINLDSSCDDCHDDNTSNESIDDVHECHEGF